jgi:flagellar biosynthesis/type III secretory pathway protein FliH
MTEIEEIKAQLKVLQSKLSFLEELEKTKSPVEEAYKDWWGEYPGDENWTSDATRWQGFQAGYNAAYEEKVSEWEPTPQTPEQVADGLKEAFREAVKQGVVSSTKSPTLYDVIAEWWEYLEDTLNMENSIQDLVNDIEEWLPTEHETNSYKWNECIRMIRGKLR